MVLECISHDELKVDVKLHWRQRAALVNAHHHEKELTLWLFRSPGSLIQHFDGLISIKC